MAVPTITVILPTRDRPHSLREAAVSACAQLLPPTELVVVNDGAPGSPEVALAPVRALTSVPIRIVAGEGRGPGAARNVGLRAAFGEVVAFLDDDDLWHPEKLTWQASWLARRPQLGALGTGAAHLTDGGVPPRRLGSPIFRRIGRAALLRANRLTTSSVAARREWLLALGGFDESLPLAQDWDMWLRLSRECEIGVLPAKLTIYRLHAGQRSTNRAEMRECEVRVVRAAMEREAGWLRGVARRRLSWAHCRRGRALLRAHQPGASQALWEAASLNLANLVAWGALARCALTRRGVVEAREL